jgi:hypothetical protein
MNIGLLAENFRLKGHFYLEIASLQNDLLAVMARLSKKSVLS